MHSLKCMIKLPLFYITHRGNPYRVSTEYIPHYNSLLMLCHYMKQVFKRQLNIFRCLFFHSISIFHFIKHTTNEKTCQELLCLPHKIPTKKSVPTYHCHKTH